MKGLEVSISEGKKGFSRIIKGALDRKERVVVTKRKKPVVVIVPYDDYQRSLRLEGYRKIMEAREVFGKAGIRAGDVYKESRKQLEEKS